MGEDKDEALLFKLLLKYSVADVQNSTTSLISLKRAK